MGTQYCCNDIHSPLSAHQRDPISKFHLLLRYLRGINLRIFCVFIAVYKIVSDLYNNLEPTKIKH